MAICTYSYSNHLSLLIWVLGTLPSDKSLIDAFPPREMDPVVEGTTWKRKKKVAGMKKASSAAAMVTRFHIHEGRGKGKGTHHDASSADSHPCACEKSTPGYMEESERFSTDAAGEEFALRAKQRGEKQVRLRTRCAPTLNPTHP